MNYYQEKVENQGNIPAQIYIGNSQCMNCHYPLHWHTHLEFNLVLEGIIKGTINGHLVTITPGDIFFVNSSDLHETDAIDQNHMRAITLLLSYDLLKEYCPDVDAYYFDWSGNDTIHQQVKKLILECAKLLEKIDPYYELQLSIALRQLCLILLKNCKHKRQEENLSIPEVKSMVDIRKVIVFIENHYEDSLSLSEIAAYIGMSPNYFSRFFKKVTNETVHSYLTRIRLYHAHKELLNSTHSITELALNNGFPNVKAFIEAFKKTYGTTPNKYKNQFAKR